MSKRLLFSFIILIFSLSSQAGGQGITDSLENALKKARKQERFDLLHQLTRAYMSVDMEKAKDYAKEAITLAANQNKPREKAIALKNTGTIWFFQGDYEQAEKNLFNSLRISEEIGFLKGIADAYNNLGIINSRRSNYSQALEYYKKSLEIKEQLNDKQGVSNTLNNIGEINKYRGDYPNAVMNYQSSYEIKKILNDKQGMANSLNNLGEIYSIWADYEKALEYYLEAASLWTEVNNVQTLSVSYHNIGELYGFLKNHDQSERYFRQALDIQRDKDDPGGMASSLRNIGSIKSEQDSIEAAKKYFDEALAIEQELGNPKGVANTLNYIGELYMKFDSLQALDYFNQSLLINQEIGNVKGIARDFFLLGSVYLTLKEYPTSLDFLKQSLKLCDESNLPDTKQSVHQKLAVVYDKLGDYENSLRNYIIYQEIKDSLYTVVIHNQIAELETKYQTDQKEKELMVKDAELARIEAEIKQRNFQRNAILGGFILLFLLAMAIYRSYIQKRKANVVLTAQKEEIEKKNQEITASIRYAKNIQNALLPHPDFIREIFDDVFIFYRPKDIVSGDFFWFGQDGRYSYVAAVDATGHGVPGAFISLLGFNLLNTTLKENHEIRPADLLDYLNRGFSDRMFKDYETEALRDSMDLALCRIDQKARKLEFSGAYNPLWVARNGEMLVQKPDRLSIGSFREYPDRRYTKYETDLKKGDMIYLFSDGFADQFGGPKSKKFMHKNLRDFLLKNSPETTNDQEAALNQSFLDWKGNQEQVDDILIIGIRIA